MTNYAWMYRVGFTPWERYARTAAASVAPLLDREERERSGRLGRALDLGCGRGLYTAELARRGWQTVGIDYVPAAVEAARRHGVNGARFLVGDVTDLPVAELGTFDFFLDIGCFQGFNVTQRQAVGRGVSAVAEPGATLLILAFGPTRLQSLLGGVSPGEVAAAFPDWELLSTEAAATAGLGWPMSRTSPRWYRLRRRGPLSE
ncbi:class I SAM-dependent methyltransferase [Nocardioides limicola]|uniref:class I SAM-dependent methyltransferase n=1 Tax=Nocardioides limicola TaxID=2803368 RepID=UPI00193AEB4D|nr:class I SAM-dependent methyltransferase [Nocardioides sp. DJM-14]